MITWPKAGLDPTLKSQTHIRDTRSSDVGGQCIASPVIGLALVKYVLAGDAQPVVMPNIGWGFGASHNGVYYRH